MTTYLTPEQWDALLVFGFDRWTADDSRRHNNLIRTLDQRQMRMCLNILTTFAPELFDFIVQREQATRPTVSGAA